MAECIKCNKQYHACPSCGLTDWEWYYCSPNCFKEVKTEKIAQIKEILKNLNPEDWNTLRTIIDETYNTNILDGVFLDVFEIE
jgi:hypothetical protein